MAYGINEFIQDALRKGASKEDISTALKQEGWPEDDIRAGLESYGVTMLAGMPVPRPKPYASAKDSFFYLLMFVTLYISAFHFGALLFDFIDIYYPDSLNVFNDMSSLRFSVASLLVAFPLYCLIMNSINKLQESKVRKWLIYLTLFVAATMIICDLIALFVALLSGEITLHFLLKFATVMLISVMIFGYYRWELGKLFQYFVIALVTAVTIAALIIAGSPTAERERRLDSQRVNDLSQISSAIDQYVEKTGHLPKALADLTKPDVARYYSLHSITDPESSLPYTYTTIGDKTYNLCAKFTRSSVKNTTADIAQSLYDKTWEHPAGNKCYELKSALKK